MEQTPEQRGKTSALERHAQTLIAALILGGVGFVVNTSIQTQGDVRLVRQSVQYLEKQLETAAGNRYTSNDASRDLKTTDAKISNLEYRLIRMEGQVKRLEQKDDDRQ